MTQFQRATEEKKKAGRRLNKPLRELYTAIVAGWKPGINQVKDEDEKALYRVILANQEATAKSLINDIRAEKQEEEESLFEEITALIGVALYKEFRARNAVAIPKMVKTIERNMSASQTIAETAREAKAIFGNYQRAHAGTVIVTEANFAVETSRYVSVVRVNDPLKNSVQQMLDLVRAGDINGARRLETQFQRVAKIPLSNAQEKLINTIKDNREKLISALPQARVLDSVQEQAEALKAEKKVWRASGINTRPTHAAADGQEQNIEDPFQVGGSLLQRPGDASLGAGLEEVINCNCVSEYI